MKKMLQSREKQVRREAQRQGYILRKNRRDGTWMVIDAELNAIAFGSPADYHIGTGGASLDEIEGWLATTE